MGNTSLLKVLIVSSRFPYPLHRGDRLRLYHQIKQLSLHFEVYLISLDDHKVEASGFQALRPFCRIVSVYRLSLLKRVFNSALGILKGWPVNVGYFFHLPTKPRLQELIAKIAPDYIYTQLIRAAPYTSDFLGVPKGIDYMDSFSLRWSRKVEESRMWKWLWNIESRRLQETERLMEAYYNDHFIISPGDADHLEEIGLRKFTQLPNGVDTSYFKPNDRLPIYDIVFVGNMQYEPNIKAVLFLIKEILPLLPTSVTILIAGAHPTNAIKSLETERIKVTGYIEDIREAYWAGKLFVAPIFMGSGMQNKILEALATGCPCISTPQVINAIKESEKIIVNAADKSTFASAIKSLLTSPERLKQKSDEGIQFVRENFSWEAAVLPLIKKIKASKRNVR